VKPGLPTVAILFVLALAATIWPLCPSAQEPARASPLVTAAWLIQHLDDASIRIIDLGKTRAQYEEAHIPGARFVDWRVDLVDPDNAAFYGVAQQEDIERLLSRLGIARDSTIVLYDSQSSRIAARMFWILRYYGHADIRILDGGASAWTAAGGSLETGDAAVIESAYRVSEIRQSVLASRFDVSAALHDGTAAFVDARAPEFYRGDSIGSQYRSDRPNTRAGHIPGAKNFFWADHLNEDGTYKSTQELAARYRAMGLGSQDAVITYCHIGLQASTAWFVLSELLGYPDVRLYDHSMAEWANIEDAALTLGAE